jgi:hypothetical protein
MHLLDELVEVGGLQIPSLGWVLSFLDVLTPSLMDKQDT